jgi:molecular chaperone DnaJ
MSKELHPDKHKGDKTAEQKFKEVNEAYEILNNPQKKQMYDQFGTAGNGGASGFGGFNGGAGGFDFSQFTQGGGDFSDLFENFFGGGGGAKARRDERGADLEMETTISLLDVVTGVKKKVEIRRLVQCSQCTGSGAEPGSRIINCPECGGTGQITRTAQSFFGAIQQRMLCPRCQGSGKVPEKPCGKCRGEGRVQESVSFTVDVPAGIDDGQTLRLRGEGDAGRRGATSGDLYVHVHVTPDKRFEREGEHIRSSVSVPAVDAILGTEISIDTVHGPVVLKIPEGTQSESILRIKGKGLPLLNSSKVGDHYVTVRVNIPTRLSREERRILEEWRNVR